MTAVRYDVSVVPTVRRFMKSDAFIRALMGPYGSGKSSGCLMDLMTRAVAQRPGEDGKRKTRWALIRNTAKQLEDTTLKTLLDWFPPGIYGDWRPSDMRYLIHGLKPQNAGRNEPPCEIELMLRALDRPEHVRNLLSLEITGAWLNEAREIPWEIVEHVQGRVGRYPPIRDNGGPTWFGVMMDTNPPDVDSKFYKFFEEEDHSEEVDALAKAVPQLKDLTVDKYCKLFRQPSGLSDKAENLKNQVPGYYQRMAIGKTKEWRKVYVDGDYGFDMDGKAVYPEYDDDFHCRPCKTIEEVPVQRGWDFGLTPACIFSQLQPTGRWIIVDELCAERSGIDKFADAVLAHSGQYYAGATFEDTGDPSGMAGKDTDERSCFDILINGKGIPIIGGLQAPMIRLESVRKPLMTLLGKNSPQLVLHPRCKKLRRGFMAGYHYRRLRTGGDRYTDSPDKNEFSHPHDALQYTATRLFGRGLRTGGPMGSVLHDNDESWPARGPRLEDGSRSGVTGY